MTELQFLGTEKEKNVQRNVRAGYIAWTRVRVSDIGVDLEVGFFIT